MQHKNARHFELLKKEVVDMLKQSYPAISDNIEEWKGQTIVFLQEDLLEKVNDQISEKWFYNHMKTRGPSLPRVDMLNLLSRYAGYADWQDFVFKHQEKIPGEIRDRSNRMFVIVPLLATAILVVIFLLFKFLSQKDYQFCFVSFDDASVAPINTQVEILNDDESPKTVFGDSTGCIRLKTDKIRVRFVVKSPYYKTDTINRVLKKFSRSETVKLKTDDYALMLHYFSNADVEDWTRRREQLDKMFANDARIYEVFQKGSQGLELYDKWEFINKLSIPTQSLRQIRILDTEYLQDRIVSLRFTQEKMNNEN